MTMLTEIEKQILEQHMQRIKPQKIVNQNSVNKLKNENTNKYDN